MEMDDACRYMYACYGRMQKTGIAGCRSMTIMLTKVVLRRSSSEMAPRSAQELSDEALARQLQEEYDEFGGDFWEDAGDLLQNDDDDFTLTTNTKKAKKPAKKGFVMNS